MKAILTTHSLERCRERCGWNQGAARRMAQRAIDEGHTRDAARGALKRYLAQAFMRDDNLRIYGEHVFVFVKGVLVTVVHLPHEHRRAVAQMKTRRAAQHHAS